MDGRRLRTQSSRFLHTTPAAKRSVTFLLPDPIIEESPPNESFIEEDDEKNNNNAAPKKKVTLSINRDRADSVEESDSQKDSDPDNKDSSNGSNAESEEEEPEPVSDPTSPSETKPLKTTPPPPAKPEKAKSKMIGRYDSFSSRATSIFHIRRGGMPLPNVPTESKEPSEFVYANILRVDDDEEELYEKEKQHSVGEGVAYISEVKYLEQEYKDTLLTSYKTNDIFYFNKDDRPKIGRVNKRVVGCGLFILLIICAIIATIFVLVPSTDSTDDVDFDHDMVYVRLGKKTPGVCQYARTCLKDCGRTIERQQGCCLGCPTRQDDPLDDNCNFNVSVGWNNVKALDLRQRVYLFASLDGNTFYQTGFAPPVVKKGAEYVVVENTNIVLPNGSYPLVKEIVNDPNESTVPNACFSTANQQVIVVACLSEYDLFDMAFDGFPGLWCNSFNGSCFNTNNAIVKDLDVCEKGLWTGNKMNSQAQWEKEFSGKTTLVKATSLKKADRPKAHIETVKNGASRQFMVSGVFALFMILGLLVF